MTDVRGLFDFQHDGSAIQSMPMLFTFTPEKPKPHGSDGFQQAGGHQGVFKSTGPVLYKRVGDRERAFYDQAKAGHWPTDLLPTYYGDSGQGDGRIGIENLTHGMKAPCVMDLKMGTSSVEKKEASFVKKMKMNALDMFTGTKNAGVRLEGLSIYRTLESGKIKTSKAQSHAISAAAHLTLQDVLMFFLTDESGVRRDIALRFQAHIEGLLRHFEHHNNQYLFIGSSILLIYDNDNRAPHNRWARVLERATRLRPDTYAGLRRKTRVDVRMIDFAHTGPLPKGQPRDEGYIKGLKSILQALQRVLQSGNGPQRPIFSLAAAAQDAMTPRQNGHLRPQGPSAPLLGQASLGSQQSFGTIHSASAPVPHPRTGFGWSGSFAIASPPAGAYPDMPQPPPGALPGAPWGAPPPLSPPGAGGGAYPPVPGPPQGYNGPTFATLLGMTPEVFSAGGPQGQNGAQAGQDRARGAGPSTPLV